MLPPDIRTHLIPQSVLDPAEFSSTLLGLLSVTLLRLGILDRQAPDIEVVADRNNDIQHETSMNTDRESETGEHECDLVDLIPESAWPAESNLVLQNGSEGVQHSIDER